MVTHWKNEDAAFTSYPLVSELSSPETAFYKAATLPLIYQLEDRPQRRKKILSGLWLWVLVALLLVLAIVGGIVGGLLGTRAHSDTAKKSNEQGNTPNENATSPNSNVTTTAPPRFASIATSKCFNETLVQVFYLDNGLLKGSLFDGEIWTDLNDISPSIKPRSSSPLAAVSWNLNGNSQVSHCNAPSCSPLSTTSRYASTTSIPKTERLNPEAPVSAAAHPAHGPAQPCSKPPASRQTQDLLLYSGQT